MHGGVRANYAGIQVGSPHWESRAPCRPSCRPGAPHGHTVLQRGRHQHAPWVLRQGRARVGQALLALQWLGGHARPTRGRLYIVLHVPQCGVLFGGHAQVPVPLATAKGHQFPATPGLTPHQTPPGTESGGAKPLTSHVPYAVCRPPMFGFLSKTKTRRPEGEKQRRRAWSTAIRAPPSQLQHIYVEGEGGRDKLVMGD